MHRDDSSPVEGRWEVCRHGTLNGTGLSYAEFRGETVVNLCLNHGILGHSCCHVRRLDGSTLDALLINGVHPVNKFCIECAIGIEIVSKASIHEDVNNIPKADKEVKVKFLQKQRQDILRPYSLEPHL